MIYSGYFQTSNTCDVLFIQYHPMFTYYLLTVLKEKNTILIVPNVQKLLLEALKITDKGL